MYPIHRRSLISMAAFIVKIFLANAIALAQPQPPVAVIQIGPFDGALSSQVRGINEAGLLAGANIGFPDEAFVWFEGEHIYLGSLYGGDTSPWAVNSSGDVVGTSNVPPFTERAFLWSNGELVELGTLGGHESEAWDINSSGQVVGFSDRESVYWPVLWDNGGVIELPALEFGGYALGINDEGIVAGGISTDGTGSSFACTWDRNLNITKLGFLPGDRVSGAYAVNENGDVVGLSAQYWSETHAVLWRGGQIIDLNDRNVARFSIAYGINNRGEIVGSGYNLGGTGPAVYWTPGLRMYNLNTLIPPNSGWNLTGAWKINDAGQIACQARRDGAYIGALVTPVTAAMSLESPAPGRAGEPNTLRVTGAAPGSRVAFLYSRRGGGTIIPGCNLQTNALQIDNPQTIGTAVADSNGVATITRTVPPVARNQTILFQAVVQNECAISQLVVHRFD